MCKSEVIYKLEYKLIAERQSGTTLLEQVLLNRGFTNREDILLLEVTAIGHASSFPKSIGLPVSSSYAILLSLSKAPIIYIQFIYLCWSSSNLFSKLLKFPLFIL